MIILGDGPNGLVELVPIVATGLAIISLLVSLAGAIAGAQHGVIPEQKAGARIVGCCTGFAAAIFLGGLFTLYLVSYLTIVGLLLGPVTGGVIAYSVASRMVRERRPPAPRPHRLDAGMTISNWRGHLLSGALWGVVVGILVGAFVYAPWMTSIDPMGEGPFRSKIEAWHRWNGIIYGMPIGAACGSLLVSALWLLRRRSPA